MVHRGSIRRFVACVLVLLVASAAPLNAKSHFSISLPNGFYIDRDDSSHLRVVNRKGKAVVPSISGYSVYNTIVTGLAGDEVNIGSAYPNDKPMPESSESRYFVLQTKSGEIDTGLSAAAWKSKLIQLGVTVAPELRAPVLPK